MARGRGENESAMALAGFLLVDIIATVTSDNIIVNQSRDGVMGEIFCPL